MVVSKVDSSLLNAAVSALLTAAFSSSTMPGIDAIAATAASVQPVEAPICRTRGAPCHSVRAHMTTTHTKIETARC
ncbi:hypothetical protein ACFUGD_29670 [Streptomyces sp. NPDC057217]|uniref:hypothetical protein n=1 Tax=Streptomyces sp. NPDC057217 TaxID=3346054 RepID=UPI003645355D